MSFRRYGGLNYAPKNNIVASNYNSINNLSVSEGVGQPNSYINFLSDISGNININGDFDISGNLHVAGNIDCSGNSTANYMFLTSGTNYTTSPNGVVPKSYVDTIGSGIRPLPLSNLISNTGPIDLSGNQTIDGVTTTNGTVVLVNAQGGQGVANINNGIYIASNTGAWSRASYLAAGDDATGTITFINNGTQYANTRWFCVTPEPAIIGTNPVLWSQYDAPFKLGRGLEVVNINNAPTIQVDSSLNFIQYLDNQGPDGAGTMNIGTNTTNINIGKSNSITGVNGKVGIGTPTPSFTLDVSGNMRFQNGNEIWANNFSGGAEQFLWPRWSDNITYLNYGSAGFNIRNNGSTSRMFIQDGGNVGIGTTAPTAALHVIKIGTFNAYTEESVFTAISNDYFNGDGRATVYSAGITLKAADLTWNNDATRSYGSRIYIGGGMSVQGALNHNVIRMETANETRLYIAANGTVGIGTTNPSFTLDVNGSIRSIGGIIFSDNAFQIDRSSTAPKTLLFKHYSNPSADFCFINEFPDGKTNVGIGTTSPTAPLHVIASSNISPDNNGVYIYNQTNSANQHAICAMRVAGSSGGNAFSSYDISGVIGWCTGIDNADGDKFKIANTWNSLSTNTRMTIDGAGNVGIGTTTPQFVLDVNGVSRTSQLYISNSSLTTNGNDLFLNTGSANTIYFRPNGPGSNTNEGTYTAAGQMTAISFNAGSDTNSGTVIIKNNSGYTSYVDIAGSEPGIRLHNNKQLGSTVGSIIPYSSFRTLVNNQSFLNTYVYRHTEGTGGGGWQGSSTRIQQTIDSTNMAYIEFNPPNATNGIGIYGYSGSNTSYGTGKGITVKSDGSVGIETTTPAHLLDVNGTCRATNFVSGSDYRLKTNIEPLLPSRTIDELKPVEYDISGNVHDMGFIAHEVEEVLPFLVHGTKDGENMQSLNYNGFIALLVKEVQELKKNNVKLTNQILDLKKIVEKLL